MTGNRIDSRDLFAAGKREIIIAHGKGGVSACASPRKTN